MPQSASLRAQDVRFLYQLVGECRDLGDDPTVWRGHWFAELGRRVAADLVVGGEASQRGGALLSLRAVDWGWQNGPNHTAFLQAMSTFDSKLASDLSNSLLHNSYQR